MVPLVASCSVYNQSEAGCSLSPLPSINLMNQPVGAGQQNTLMSETTPGGISRSSMKYIILLLIQLKYTLSQSTGFEVTRQKHEKTSPRSVSFQYDHFPAVAAIIAGGTTHSPRSGANDRISGCQAFSDVLGFKDGAVYPMIQGIMSTGPGLILVPSFVPILLFFGINYTSFPTVQSYSPAQVNTWPGPVGTIVLPLASLTDLTKWLRLHARYIAWVQILDKSLISQTTFFCPV